MKKSLHTIIQYPTLTVDTEIGQVTARIMSDDEAWVDTAVTVRRKEYHLTAKLRREYAPMGVKNVKWSIYNRVVTPAANPKGKVSDTILDATYDALKALAETLEYTEQKVFGTAYAMNRLHCAMDELEQAAKAMETALSVFRAYEVEIPVGFIPLSEMVNQYIRDGYPQQESANV